MGPGPRNPYPQLADINVDPTPLTGLTGGRCERLCLRKRNGEALTVSEQNALRRCIRLGILGVNPDCTVVPNVPPPVDPYSDPYSDGLSSLNRG